MKKVLLIIGLVFGTLVLGIIFLLIGMNIGGNYFTNFELFGSRGYEATANLGFTVGIVIGTIISFFVYIKIYRKT